MTRAEPNTAVVVLDALRADTFEEHFGWLPGCRYERAYTTANFTAPAHGSLFTGRYPSEHGVVAGSRTLDVSGPVLAETLAARGYRTRGLSANVQVGSERAFDRGFGTFRDAWVDYDFRPAFDWLSHVDATEPGLGRYLTGLRDSLTHDAPMRSLRRGLALAFGAFDDPGPDKGVGTLREALETMQFSDSGEFLFLNLMEVHDPYVAPDAYLGERVGKVDWRANFDVGDDAPTNPPQRDAYEACAAHLSDTYREAFRVLERSFDYVVTTSDHGHAFGEKGVWGHGYGLVPAITRVPLCVSDGDGRRTDDRTASLLDVHRTVLDLAGAEGVPSRGANLLTAPPEDRAVLTEYHGLYWNWREGLRRSGLPAAEVAVHDCPRRGIALDRTYAHQTPGGLTVRGDDDDGRLRERLAAVVGTLDRQETRQEEGRPGSAAARDRLRELGYR